MRSGFCEADEDWEMRHGCGAWNGEAIPEKLVIGDAELAAGLEQAEHGVPCGLACLADASIGQLF